MANVLSFSHKLIDTISQPTSYLVQNSEFSELKHSMGIKTVPLSFGEVKVTLQKREQLYKSSITICVLSFMIYANMLRNGLKTAQRWIVSMLTGEQGSPL
jgi:hypothetical protein